MVGPVPARFGYDPAVGKPLSQSTHAIVPAALLSPTGNGQFSLFYPASGATTDTLVLRNPNLGNKTRISANRVARESRGGTLIVYADPMWPVTETWVLSFSVLTRSVGLALLAFLDAHLGMPIGIVDWQGRQTTGIITDVGDGLIQDKYCSYSASFTYEVITTPETANAGTLAAIPAIPVGL